MCLCFFHFFSRAFFCSVSVAIKGGPGHQCSANSFSEASFLTCTLFLRRAASSRAHDGYRAGSRDAPGEDGHAARRSLKSGQGPSRLLRPGEGKEVRLSASAQQAGPPVDMHFEGQSLERRASGAARAVARVRRRRKEAASGPQRPPTSTPITTRRQRALARSSG